MKYTELEMKFWRMALDKSAAEAEWKFSMEKIGKSLRERNVKPEELGISSSPETNWGSTTFSFGKHNGETIEQVAFMDSSYLSWVMDMEDEDFKLRHRYLRMAIENFFKQQHRKDKEYYERER